MKVRSLLNAAIAIFLLTAVTTLFPFSTATVQAESLDRGICEETLASATNVRVVVGQDLLYFAKKEDGLDFTPNEMVKVGTFVYEGETHRGVWWVKYKICQMQSKPISPPDPKQVDTAELNE